MVFKVCQAYSRPFTPRNFSNTLTLENIDEAASSLASDVDRVVQYIMPAINAVRADASAIAEVVVTDGQLTLFEEASLASDTINGTKVVDFINTIESLFPNYEQIHEIYDSTHTIDAAKNMYNLAIAELNPNRYVQTKIQMSPESLFPLCTNRRHLSASVMSNLTQIGTAIGTNCCTVFKPNTFNNREVLCGHGIIDVGSVDSPFEKLDGSGAPLGFSLANLKQRGTYILRVSFGSLISGSKLASPYLVNSPLEQYQVATEFGSMMADNRYTPGIWAGPLLETDQFTMNGFIAPDLTQQIGAQLILSKIATALLIGTDEKNLIYKIITTSNDTEVSFYTSVPASVYRGGLAVVVEKLYDYKMVKVKDLVGSNSPNPISSDIDFKPIVRLLSYFSQRVGNRFIQIIARRISGFYTPTSATFKLDQSPPNVVNYPVAVDTDAIASLGECIFNPECFFNGNVGLLRGNVSISIGPEQQKELYCKYVEALRLAIEDNEIQLKLIEGYLGMSVRC